MGTELGSVGLTDVLADDVGFLLSRASVFALRAANPALAPYGLKPRHYATLHLAAARDGVPQRQIGLLLGLDPSIVVALLDDLESRGLVVRSTSSCDRRSRVVALTDQGERLLDAAQQAMEGIQESVTAALSQEERAVLTKLLRRMIGAG